MVRSRDDRRLSRRAPRGPTPATPPGEAGELIPADNPHAHTPGHPDAHGTLPMAHYLTDPTIEEEIQALAAEAGLPSPDQAARLARLLRLGRQQWRDAA
jgi:hypothetical protein